MVLPEVPQEVSIQASGISVSFRSPLHVLGRMFVGELAHPAAIQTRLASLGVAVRAYGMGTNRTQGTVEISTIRLEFADDQFRKKRVATFSTWDFSRETVVISSVISPRRWKAVRIDSLRGNGLPT